MFLRRCGGTSQRDLLFLRFLHFGYAFGRNDKITVYEKKADLSATLRDDKSKN